MNSLQIYNQLQEEEKYLKEKLLEFLQPLTERYVTKIWFFTEYEKKYNITYKPLQIDIKFSLKEIDICITFFSGYNNSGEGNFSIQKKDFLKCIGEDDYSIDSIKKIIIDIKNNAYPIFHKWGFAVAHIEDIEKKFFVATNLEKEIKSISNVTSEKVIDLVKEIESRYVNP